MVQHSSLGQCLYAQPCDSKSNPPCTLPTAWGTVFAALGETLHEHAQHTALLIPRIGSMAMKA